MTYLPATSELLAFCGCLFLCGILLKVSIAMGPSVAKSMNSLFARITAVTHFPRSLIHPDVSVYPPLRKISLRRFAYKFKFTLFMFFLNVYTFIFTNDFTNGEINPNVLESRGFSYLHFAEHKWFILVTSNFIHFHLPHLMVNMVMLLIFSGSLELLKGARFAAIVYFVAMNSDVPNGLFLLPGLKLLYPQVWNETVQYVDVGASLGIIGSLGALARLLTRPAKSILLGFAIVGTVVGAVYIHNLFGIDHCFSAIIGYLTADHLLKKQLNSSKALELPRKDTKIQRSAA